MYYYNIKNISVYSIIGQFEWGVHNIPGTGLDAGDTAVNKTDERVKLPPLTEEKQLFKKRERENNKHNKIRILKIVSFNQ